MEVAVGYIFAWAVRKARLVAGRADGEVDRALGAGMDRVHDVVSRKLGQDAALVQVVEEANADPARLSEDSRQWLALSLNNAAKRDAEFAAELLAAVEAARVAERAARVQASGDGVAIGGGVSMHAESGSVVAVRIDGPVTIGSPAPSPPGAAQG
ncbi:chromosome partitioning protein [Kitasatospora azatica]|uniref:chromosome partitioning protein n=1 Tax=Kitasatospora azatica TaxID=58347 RepID=UPI000A5D1B76|nr:chromosome partitioning protein [Kitasatospora azatica]